MNNTQKILIAIGVGVGVAYLYKRYKKGKTTTKPSTGSTPASSDLPTKEIVPTTLSREEKEEFILENLNTTPKEVASGFEGTRFVWNPTIGKMYPVGTIEVGQEPAFADTVFLGADGDIQADIPKSVETAENILKALNDAEIDLLYNVVKKKSENPSMSSEDALKDLGVTNPRIFELFRKKLNKTSNDIKILKKDGKWSGLWEKRKQARIKRRQDFVAKMGFEKSIFDKQVRKICGTKRFGQKAQYKKCVESVADAIRKEMKTAIREEVSDAPVLVKDTINRNRQQQFMQQVTNRKDGAMFGGRRWDGESNSYVESLVDKGLV